MEEIYKRWSHEYDLEDEIDEPSEIQDFFTDQTIFLTGCTGFVGKLLVEKLLRSCPNIRRLYVLVRSKKLASHERMKKYFDDVIFERMKMENPKFASIVTMIEGDLTIEGLGLSDADKSILVNETTLIYHNASNVKFDEKISTAIRVNVMGTVSMLDLAKECKKLRAFVYISTAYSHSYQQHIEEKFYPAPTDMKTISALMTADDATPGGIDDKTLKQIRDQWQNNYVFTKSMAESLVEECAKTVNFTCVVFRPSIIISTYLEPIRGWCGNINGPTGAIIGSGIGFIHSCYKGDAPIDYIPGDMCASALISLTWDAVVNKKFEKEGLVYNYGSSTVNRMSIRTLGDYSYVRGIQTPSIYMVGSYWVKHTNFLWLFLVLHFTVHLWTALVADTALLLRGEKRRVVSFWILMTKNLGTLIHFTTGNWRIHVHQMQTVWDRMNRRDAKLFFNDVRKFDWEDFCYAYWAGLRLYVLKDSMETVNAGLRHFRRLMVIDNVIYATVKILILYYLFQWLYSMYRPLFPTMYPFCSNAIHV